MTVPEMGRTRRFRSGERDSGPKNYHAKRRRLDEYGSFENYYYSSGSRDLSRRNNSHHDACYQSSKDNSHASSKYNKHSNWKQSESDRRRRHRQRHIRHRSKSSNSVSAVNSCDLRFLFPDQGHQGCLLRGMINKQLVNGLDQIVP